MNSQNSHKKPQNSIEFHRIHIETTQNTQVGTRIHTQSWDAYPYTQLGTRIHTQSWDAYTHTKLGRVYTCTLCVRARVHSLRTLINSSFGTRIGTLIWDAYPCTKLGRVYIHNLGRVSIHTIRDAYPYTQLGTRIYTHKVGTRIHTYKKNKTNHKQIIETTQIFIEIIKFHTNSQRMHRKIHKIQMKSQKNHKLTQNSKNFTNILWVGHKKSQKLPYIYISIYIQRKINIHSKKKNHEPYQR